jgi:broad specificity phosphatase PhoE
MLRVKLQSKLLALLLGQLLGWGATSLAQTQPVSVLIVRHGESDPKQPNQPLTETGRARAELLASTVRGIKFTHLFASHTTRSRQMLELIAAKQTLPIVQLPAPGEIHDGEAVTDKKPDGLLSNQWLALYSSCPEAVWHWLRLTAKISLPL